WFSVALLVGLFAGTYSSIYIATSYALAMGLSKEDFIIKPKEEFVEEGVVEEKK
ncbi:MAG: protein translocase subunit SecF, partial [Pseudomonadales bacterium]|nr:protein translocase subunit SecF [Pseudomonadales bacterium]